ncbi:hypothetical protein VTI74DRAFT_9685 [Chaetomium olivicolor]
MPLNNDNIPDDGSWHYVMEGVEVSKSSWPSQRRSLGRLHHGMRKTLLNMKTGLGRVKRQKKGVVKNHHDTALKAIFAATMLAFIPFCKPLATLDHRLAKHILLPKHRPTMEEDLFAIGCKLLSPVESLLPPARGDACPIRSRLAEPEVDSISFGSTDNVVLRSTENLAVGSTDSLGPRNTGDPASRSVVIVETTDLDLDFDDDQCVSVDRSTEKFRFPLETPTTVPEANEGNITKELGPHLDWNLEDMPVIPEQNRRPQLAGPSSANLARAFLPPMEEDHQDTPALRKTLSDLVNYSNLMVNQNCTNFDDGRPERMRLPFIPSIPKTQQRGTNGQGANTLDSDTVDVGEASSIPTDPLSAIKKQQRTRNRALKKSRTTQLLSDVKKKRRPQNLILPHLWLDTLKRPFQREPVGKDFGKSKGRKSPKCVSVGAKPPDTESADAEL